MISRIFDGIEKVAGVILAIGAIIYIFGYLFRP